MPNTNQGVVTAGKGTGDPTRNFHALGNQNASDTFDVGPIAAKNLLQPADVLRCKSVYETHGQWFTTRTREVLHNHAANVFQPAAIAGVAGVDSSKMENLYSDRVYEFMRVQLNTAISPVKKLGTPKAGVSSWRPLDKETVPKGYHEMKQKYSYYKVTNTHLKLTLDHRGDSSEPFTGMPVQLWGYRVNTHNRSAVIPNKVCQILEHPHGFKIGQPLYPIYASTWSEAITGVSVPAITNKTSFGATNTMFEFNYSPDDVTTRVDLDGDTANKALWSATDASPIETQEIIIFAQPLEQANRNWDKQAIGHYFDACLHGYCEVTQTIQFRDPFYHENNLNKVQDLNGTYL